MQMSGMGTHESPIELKGVSGMMGASRPEEGELVRSESESESAREIRLLKKQLQGYKVSVETHTGVWVPGLQLPRAPPLTNLLNQRVIIEESPSDSEELDPVAESNAVIIYNEVAWPHAPPLLLAKADFQHQNQHRDRDEFRQGFGDMLGDEHSRLPP